MPQSPQSCPVYHTVPPSPTSLPPTHMEVTIHVEADNAEVVGSGNIRDDALSASALFRHPHPHVPVPELGTQKTMKVKRFGARRGLQPTHPTTRAPFLVWATWAQAPPCTRTSSAPSPGQAWSPHGIAVLGPQPCVHTPGDGGPWWEVSVWYLYRLPSWPLSTQPTWSFQAEIQYTLSSSSSRWMDWLRKLREAGAKVSGKGKDKPNHTVMLERLAMGLRNHASLALPPNSHCLHSSFLLSGLTLTLAIPALLQLFTHF